MDKIKKFKKRIGNFDKNWKSIRLPSEIPFSILQVLRKVEKFDIAEFILFNYTNDHYWFGMNTHGIFLFDAGKLIFIKYTEIIDSKIIFDLNEKNIDKIKNSASEINVFTPQNTFRLMCNNDSSVYLIQRLINTGIQLNEAS